MALAKFLDSGAAVETRVPISMKNPNIKVRNPETFRLDTLQAKALGRIHSEKMGVYTVWILDEITYNTVILDVPMVLMGQFFQPSSHNIFPHFAVR